MSTAKNQAEGDADNGVDDNGDAVNCVNVVVVAVMLTVDAILVGTTFMTDSNNTWQ